MKTRCLVRKRGALGDECAPVKAIQKKNKLY